MRNTILAAAAAFALVLATAPSFAAPTQSQSNSSNNYSRCADILANQAGHTSGEVQFCRSQ
jgi:hypothetical protein